MFDAQTDKHEIFLAATDFLFFFHCSICNLPKYCTWYRHARGSVLVLFYRCVHRVIMYNVQQPIHRQHDIPTLLRHRPAT